MKVTDEVLGEGTYGDVRKGYNRRGEPCAIKTFHVDTLSEGIDIGIMRELAYLRSLPSHPNIIKLGEIDWCAKSHKIRAELPCYQRDLNNHIKKDLGRKPLPREKIFSFAKQLLLALEHCHKYGVFHRDVKPANILLDQNGNLVLCDFSLASNFVSKIDHSCTVQTLWYRAVEILMGCIQYDAGVDVWSFGCVLAFMMTGGDILQGDCDYGQLMKIFELFGTPDLKQWPEMRDFKNYNGDKWPKFPATNVSETLFSNAPDAKLYEIFTKSMIYRPRLRATASQLLELINKN
jgi:serine/threonine protein kinase